jgi:hypothetical protein
MLLNATFQCNLYNFNEMKSLHMCQNQCKVIKRTNSIMQHEKMFLYFRYKEKKMQGTNNNFTFRPYCKKKETSQAGYREENTQTNVQGEPMKNMKRKSTAQKFNNKKISYHSIIT